MARQYVIKAKVGEYKDQNGQMKTKYLEIGAVFDGQNGLVLKLDAVPTGWDGFAFLQVPEQRGQRGSNQQGGNRQGGNQGYQRGNQQNAGNAYGRGGSQEQFEQDGGDDIPFN